MSVKVVDEILWFTLFPSEIEVIVKHENIIDDLNLANPDESDLVKCLLTCNNLVLKVRNDHVNTVAFN